MSRSVAPDAGPRQPEPLDRRQGARSSDLDPRQTAPPSVESGRSNDLDQDAAERSRSLDQRLADLRKCADDLDWSNEAIAAHRGDTGSSYVNKVMNGDKPMSLEFFESLPQDIRDLHHERELKKGGAIVVRQLDWETAKLSLVAGLVGVLAGLAADRMLPAQSGGQLKAELPLVERRKVG